MKCEIHFYDYMGKFIYHKLVKGYTPKVGDTIIVFDKFYEVRKYIINLDKNIIIVWAYDTSRT